MPGIRIPEGFQIEVLGAHHDREGFSSGSSPLDEYLLHRAGQDIRRRVAACFVLCSKASDNKVVGYYTLSATSIVLSELPETLRKKLPRYPALPATLMGRLAVDTRHRGQGFGELLLFDGFSRALQSEIASFAFVVDAKDDDAQRFYRRYGFLPLQEGHRRLFIPLAEIASLFI